MEIYILDSLLRRTQVVDNFESLIWTERWTELGDFELKMISTKGTRGMFLPGVRLAMNQSYRVMVVESTEDATADDGSRELTVKGHSLETLLNDRVAAKKLAANQAVTTVADGSSSQTEVSWTITDTPAAIARTIFDQICRQGILSTADVIPMLQPGTIFPVGTIAEPSTTVTWAQSIDTLFNAIKAICDQYSLGFRLVRNFDTSTLYFDIYAGNDRTTKQTVLNPVVFSTSLDNLQNTTEFSTTENAKNCAYVFSSQGYQTVYPPDVDPNVAGFDRRVLVVNASEVPNPTPNATGTFTPTAAQITAYLTQVGLEELGKNRGSTVFDGELNQNSAYKYGTDYLVGDLVEMRNTDGVVTQRRVTEQIFVCDSEGERSYPTLAAGIFEAGNTWLYQKTKVWSDYDTDLTSTWATQP